jgi:integrase/recombinase XerD
MTKPKLRKKTITIVEKACNEVSGFRKLYEEFSDKITLSDQSKSLLTSYGRRLAHLSLHFGKLPQDISEKEINQYLVVLAKQSKTPSRSTFKFTVYSLRYCYRMLGLNKNNVQLPLLHKDKKLPVVMNHRECKDLFRAPVLLKHRVLLSFLYSGGFRAQEVSRIMIADIDSERMMVHVKRSKYNKDRYVPLSPLILVGLRKYLRECNPKEYLFNGQKPGSQLSVTGMNWALGQAKKKCNLQKRITLHTFRHSYATHLLEFGVDIVTIKELLGHARIETTMVYLHVINLPNRSNLFSPFDKLYPSSDQAGKKD